MANVVMGRWIKINTDSICNLFQKIIVPSNCIKTSRQEDESFPPSENVSTNNLYWKYLQKKKNKIKNKLY